MLADVPENISASSWLVADLDSGEVLGTCGPHEYGAPASLQKLLLAADRRCPKLDPAAQVTITAEDLDFEPGSSAVGLILGGTYTIDDDLVGADAQLGQRRGERVGPPGRWRTGRRRHHRRHERAGPQAPGADDTTARTPSGLDGPGQVTSAYDPALIFRACFANENFRRYTGAKMAQMPPQPPKDPNGFQIQNDNRLLFEYPGGIGGKTGFTDIARHTYVGAAERDGRRLVVAVLGAEHQPVKTWMQGAALLDWGFSVPGGQSGRPPGRAGDDDRKDEGKEQGVVASNRRRHRPRPRWSSRPRRSTDRTDTWVGAARGRGGFPHGVVGYRPVDPPAAGPAPSGVRRRGSDRSDLDRGDGGPSAPRPGLSKSKSTGPVRTTASGGTSRSGR